uniref:C-type lectin domain-containing protein n=1 Tax=Knipowitschia caucasica TaxID=637954 RepID=A0AAV2LXQ4_KNICA
MTWPAAQQFCRENYDDLATFTNMDDIRRVTRPSDYIYAWIGLIDDLTSWSRVMSAKSNSWRRSSTDSTSPGGFQAPWEKGEPNFHMAAETCLMMRNGLWLDANCQSNNVNFAVCVNGKKTIYANNV